MSTRSYTVIDDPEYGYRRLEPLPTPEDLDIFYGQQYYGLIGAGGRAPSLKRLMAGGVDAEFELNWLSKTAWRDIADVIEELRPGRDAPSLLDVGCGPGYFTRYVAERGWQVTGVEPSEDAAAAARSTGMSVFSTLGACAAAVDRPFDVVTLLYVLEHVVDPVGMLKAILPLLHEDGVLVIQVPNDFSRLQLSAQEHLGRDPWWVAIPDHVNYFNFASLASLLERLGYQVIDALAGFPMELFLLFGDVYLGDPELGSSCHRKRVAFETAIPAALRRDLYRSLASQGVGRDSLVFARRAPRAG